MASNRDWGVSGSTLSIPPFIGPNDPGIIIGFENPPDLVAYYAGFGDTLISTIVFRSNATDYDYIALVIDAANTPFLAFGSANPLAVNEMQTIFQVGANPELILGSGSVGVVAVAAGALFSIRPGAGFNIDGISQPRGQLDFVSSTANTAAVGVETVILTSNNKTYIDGRAYTIEVHEVHRPTGGATLAFLNIRKTNLAGVVKIGELCPINGGADTTGQVKGIVRNISGANVTTVVVATIAPFPAGTVQGIGSATQLRWMEIMDAGDAVDFPNAIQI